MLPSPSRLRPLDPQFLEGPRGQLRLVPRENRVAVLLNAHAKRVNSRVRRLLEEVVPQEDLFFSRSMEEGAEQARTILERRYGTLMVGGGDGTLVATMNLLLSAAAQLARGSSRHALPDLGILRLGTGNGLATLTGSGAPLTDLSAALAGERTQVHTLPLVEDVKSGWVFPFASAGYDAQLLNDYLDIVNAVESPLAKTFAKSLGGYFYALGTRTIPAEMRGRRPHVRLVSVGRSSIIDPETEEEVALEAGSTLFEGSARAVLVGTSPFYGYALKVLPFARRRSDRFHVRVSSASIPFILSHLPGLWKGTLKTPQFVDFLSEGVRIESSVPLPVQMGGDGRGYTDRLELRLSDRCFRFLGGAGRPVA